MNNLYPFSHEKSIIYIINLKTFESLDRLIYKPSRSQSITNIADVIGKLVYPKNDGPYVTVL